MTVFYQDQAVQLLNGDVLAMLKTLPDDYVQTVVTSPPYWGLRDYKVDGQIGLESTPDSYVQKMVDVFREVRRVLKDDGTLWLNLGDSYAGSGKGPSNEGSKQSTNAVSLTGASHRNNGQFKNGQAPTAWIPIPKGIKPKDMVGIPWRVAFALQADGWWLRSDIIWNKPNPMPESVTDRPTKAHEYIFLMAKSDRYFYDAAAIEEPGIKTGTPGHLQGGRGTRAGNREGLKPNDGQRWNENNGRGFLPKRDKQRGHSRRHNGFNDRWDRMELEQQCSGMRNKRTVWTIPPQPFLGAHFATFPESLIEPCILAGAPEGGLVLDPFAGASTTLLVAKKLNRLAIGIELNPDYCAIGVKRLSTEPARLL